MTTDNSGDEQAPSASPGRRDVLRVVTGLGLGHITILSVGSPAAAAPPPEHTKGCGLYNPINDNLIRDLGCNTLTGDPEGNVHSDEGCGKATSWKGTEFEADEDCGNLTPDGKHPDNDCSKTKPASAGGGKFTDEDCGKTNPGGGLHDDNDCYWTEQDGPQ